MVYKIMIDNEYETEGGITESIPVEYDGITYESRIEAWRAYWESKHSKDKPVKGYHVYVKEV